MKGRRKEGREERGREVHHILYVMLKYWLLIWGHTLRSKAFYFTSVKFPGVLIGFNAGILSFLSLCWRYLFSMLLPQCLLHTGFKLLCLLAEIMILLLQNTLFSLLEQLLTWSQCFGYYFNELFHIFAFSLQLSLDLK